MSSSRMIWPLGLLTISFTSAAYGDVPMVRFGPKQPMVAPVEIVDGKIDHADPHVVAKIVIPESLLPDLQESSYPPPRNSNEPSDAGMVLFGFGLAAFAIVLMFTANKQTRNWKMGVICVSSCAVLVGLMLVMNFLFPSKVLPPSGELKAQPRIIVEIQQGGHEVTLVLSKGK